MNLQTKQRPIIPDLEGDPELCEQRRHAPRLGVQVVDAVREEEDAEAASGEAGPGAQDVRQEEGQAAVVVQPVHVDQALEFNDCNVIFYILFLIRAEVAVFNIILGYLLFLHLHQKQKAAGTIFAPT